MKISIIIAAYNVEKFIEKCIYSCVHQNIFKTDYEILVVNDGSTDATADVLNKLTVDVKNLQVIHQENAGLGACRNTGLKHSKGKYVWFIDGDDYLEENILQNIVNEIEKSNLDVLVLNYTTVDEQYNTIATSLNKVAGVKNVVAGSEFYKYNYINSYTWLFVFKRNLFLNGEITFRENINMQDSEILPKLLINTHRLAFLNKVCYYYVQQVNSFTNNSNGQKRFKYFESIIEVRYSLQNFLTKKVANDSSMKIGIEKKLEAMQSIVFMHLIFFAYEREWLNKIIKLLKHNEFYPLKYKAKGKMKIIKYGMNMNPLLTKMIIDFMRKKVI